MTLVAWECNSEAANHEKLLYSYSSVLRHFEVEWRGYQPLVPTEGMTFILAAQLGSPVGQRQDRQSGRVVGAVLGPVRRKWFAAAQPSDSTEATSSKPAITKPSVIPPQPPNRSMNQGGLPPFQPSYCSSDREIHSSSSVACLEWNFWKGAGNGCRWPRRPWPISLPFILDRHRPLSWRQSGSPASCVVAAVMPRSCATTGSLIRA